MIRTSAGVLVVLWLAMTGWGSWKALQYQMTPGGVHNPPAKWPNGSRLTPEKARPTLLLFMHPKCPCTRATLNELDRLVAEHRGNLRVYAVVMLPPGAPADWQHTDLVTRAAAIPEVHVMLDHDSLESKLFRMNVSGETLLYGSDRKLLFHGGLTSGRGHEGDSQGRAIITAALNGETTAAHRTAVFGCPFQSDRSGN